MYFVTEPLRADFTKMLGQHKWNKAKEKKYFYIKGWDNRRKLYHKYEVNIIIGRKVLTLLICTAQG